MDQEDHDTPTIRLWAEGSSFELLVLVVDTSFWLGYLIRREGRLF